MGHTHKESPSTVAGKTYGPITKVKDDNGHPQYFPAKHIELIQGDSEDEDALYTKDYVIQKTLEALQKGNMRVSLLRPGHLIADTPMTIADFNLYLDRPF